MLLVLRVHHHHVDHEAHDGEAKDQAKQEGVPPPGGTEDPASHFFHFHPSTTSVSEDSELKTRYLLLDFLRVVQVVLQGCGPEPGGVAHT